MLLVDYRETEVVELHRVFEHGMGADEDVERAVEELRVNFPALFGAGGAGEKAHIDANLRGKRADGLVVLSGKNFGGSHHAGLIAVVDGQKHGHQRHEGLPGTDVALHEAVHLAPGVDIGADFLNHTLLRTREVERQAGRIEVVEIFSDAGEAEPFGEALAAPRTDEHVGLDIEQFLKLHALARFLQCGGGGGPVKLADGGVETDKAAILDYRARKGFGKCWARVQEVANPGVNLA